MAHKHTHVSETLKRQACCCSDIHSLIFFKDDLRNVPCRFLGSIIGSTTLIFKWKFRGIPLVTSSIAVKPVWPNGLIEKKKKKSTFFGTLLCIQICVSRYCSSLLLYPLVLMTVLLIQFKTPFCPKGAYKIWILSAVGMHFNSEISHYFSTDKAMTGWKRS